jgi:hypothetical protein
MLMMRLMRPPDGFKIKAVAVSENLKPLMNKYIMNEKIGHAIQRDAYANPENKIKIIHPSKK